MAPPSLNEYLPPTINIKTQTFPNFCIICRGILEMEASFRALRLPRILRLRNTLPRRRYLAIVRRLPSWQRRLVEAASLPGKAYLTVRVAKPEVRCIIWFSLSYLHPIDEGKKGRENLIKRPEYTIWGPPSNGLDRIKRVPPPKSSKEICHPKFNLESKHIFGRKEYANITKIFALSPLTGRCFVF